MFGTMFTTWNWNKLFGGGLMGLGLEWKDYIILLAGLVILLTVSLVQRRGKVRDKIASKPVLVRLAVWYGLFLIVLLFGAYGIGYDASQFIYNQF